MPQRIRRLIRHEYVITPERELCAAEPAGPPPHRHEAGRAQPGRLGPRSAKGPTLPRPGFRVVLVALAAALLGVPAASRADQKKSLDQVISGIELRYNRLATLQVDFEHTVRYLERVPLVERGTLYLQRPGKMRWEYSRPAGKLLVGDGDLLHYYNPLSNQVRRLRPNQTGDLRVPLSFLLGRLHFKRQFKDLRLEQSEGRSVLICEGRTGKEAYTRVEFTYDPADFRLLHLKVQGQDESLTTFDFSDESVNPRLQQALFEFRPPAGAEVIDQADLGGAN